MTRHLGLILIFLVVMSCSTTRTQEPINKINIRGSWYSDLGRGGFIDSLVNYGEIYITDSTFEYYDEIAGHTWLQRYYIKNDSIYKCWSVDPECQYIPMFHIDRFKDDTIWLTVHPKYSARLKDNQAIYTRLPKGENGYYDYTWTPLTVDSLNYVFNNDWDRRKWKFHYTRLGKLDEYDSLVKSGRWTLDWTEINESEKRNCR